MPSAVLPPTGHVPPKPESAWSLAPAIGLPAGDVRVRVCLVGAGPGDPELITLKAVRVLQHAQVVLVDELVNRALLQHCPQARIVHVGKRGGCRSTPQAFIQRLMWRYARQGLRVVRLKGGDPGVFGRAGEEMQWLRERGVACEVVNGITAGMAAATACGVPLTMRGMTQGVTLLTGHTEHGDAPDWRALVAGGTTLVIYMGVSTLAHTRSALLAAGMRPDMPVAMVENASLPQQRHGRSTLQRVLGDAQAFALRSPAVLVVGAVAGLADAPCDGRDVGLDAQPHGAQGPWAQGTSTQSPIADPHRRWA